MTADVIPLAFAAWGGGYLHHKLRRRKYRHQHTWEVVEQTPVEGTTINQAIQAAKASGYAVDISEIMEYVKPQAMIVHYRCACGQEQVKRV